MLLTSRPSILTFRKATSDVDESNVNRDYSPEIDVDDSSNGGKSGIKLFKKGGGEDDYDGEFDYVGKEGDGWLESVFPENYRKTAIDAVLDEWFQARTALPVFLKSLVTMGVVSSQELSRFFYVERKTFLASCPWSLRQALTCR